MKRIVCIAAAFLIVSACGRGDFNTQSPGQGSSSNELVVGNGLELNGLELNGLELNGLELNGLELNGLELNGVQLVGSEFTGEVDGSHVEGMDFVGATMTGQTSDGGQLNLRIDAIDVQNLDVWRYWVSFQNDQGDWSRLCGRDSDGNPIPATALSGTWNYDRGVPGGGSHTDDPTVFTFACMHTALGKCVNFGYKPWVSVKHCNWDGCQAVSLADVHQACTRMVRADYCGDGEPHTVNGTPIDVVDDLGIQARSVRSWVIEAEWSPDGAPCVARLRINGGKPWCAEAKRDETCGDPSHYWSGTLLMDYIQERLTYLNIDLATTNELIPILGGAKPPRLPPLKIPDIGTDQE